MKACLDKIPLGEIDSQDENLLHKKCQQSKVVVMRAMLLMLVKKPATYHCDGSDSGTLFVASNNTTPILIYSN